MRKMIQALVLMVRFGAVCHIAHYYPHNAARMLERDGMRVLMVDDEGVVVPAALSPRAFAILARYGGLKRREQAPWASRYR